MESTFTTFVDVNGRSVDAVIDRTWGFGTSAVGARQKSSDWLLAPYTPWKSVFGTFYWSRSDATTVVYPDGLVLKTIAVSIWKTFLPPKNVEDIFKTFKEGNCWCMTSKIHNIGFVCSFVLTVKKSEKHKSTVIKTTVWDVLKIVDQSWGQTCPRD